MTTAEYRYVRVTTAEQYWIKKAQSNPADFITYITDGQMRPAKHHLEWIYHILGSSGSRVNIIAPRGSGKTNTLNMIMAWWIGKRPWTNNAILSVSFSQASERLDDIRAIIKSERYQNVFPWIHLDYKRKVDGKIHGRPDNTSEFSIWSSIWISPQDGKTTGEAINYSQWRSYMRQHADAKGRTLYAAGITGKSIPGKRFNGLVLVDDPHDEENSASQDQRDKVEALFKKTLIGCVTPEGLVTVISTRWAEDDLSGRLSRDKYKDGSLIWETIEIPAINEDGESYWPEVWSLDDLEDRRSEIGETSFQMMYMNNPNARAAGQFKIDDLRQPIPAAEDLPDMKEIFISTDIARSLSAHADFTVYAIVSRDTRQKYGYYVWDIWRGKVGFSDSLDVLANYVDWCVDTFGGLRGVLFEKQGFQPAWAEELQNRRPDIPIILVPLKGDKVTRAKALEAKTQAGKFYCNQKMQFYETMVSELLGFTGESSRKAKDDIVDALALPFQYWGWHKRIAKSGVKKIQSPYLL